MFTGFYNMLLVSVVGRETFILSINTCLRFPPENGTKNKGKNFCTFFGAKTKRKNFPLDSNMFRYELISNLQL